MEQLNCGCLAEMAAEMGCGGRERQWTEGNAHGVEKKYGWIIFGGENYKKYFFFEKEMKFFGNSFFVYFYLALR